MGLMGTLIAVLVAIAALLAVILLAAAVHILREYERAVVFRHGRPTAEKSPGLILLIPAVDRMARVGLRR